MVSKIGAIFGAATIAGVSATLVSADEDSKITIDNLGFNSNSIQEIYMAGANAFLRLKAVDGANNTFQMQFVQPSLGQVHNIPNVTYSFDEQGKLSVHTGEVESGFYTNNQIDDLLNEGQAYAVSRKIESLQKEFEQTFDFNPDDYKIDVLDTAIETELAKDGGLTLAYNDVADVKGRVFVGREAVNKIAVVPDDLGYVSGTESENCTILSDNSAICINTRFEPSVYGSVTDSSTGQVVTTLNHYVLIDSEVVPLELMRAEKEWGALPDDVKVAYEEGHNRNLDALGLTTEQQRHDSDPNTSKIEADSVRPAYTAYTP